MQPVRSEKSLYIPRGSITEIIAHLRKKGYDVGFVDRYLLRFIGTPQRGWIAVEKTVLNRIDFLHKLTNSKAVIDKITLIPGETTEIFFRTLAKRYDMNATKLREAYRHYSPYPEAGILPDTYFVPHGISEKNLVKFLVKSSEKRYKKLAHDFNMTYTPQKWQKILTVASIVQKEAANTEEMPLIASVVYNRLKKKMRLQMDGTLNYGIYSHVKVTPKRIKDDNSTFNTYKHKGLPDSPVSTVSVSAIKAALRPAKSDYLYFVKNRSGTHTFSKTFRQHRKEIKRNK